MKQKRADPNVVLSFHPAPILKRVSAILYFYQSRRRLQTAQLFENFPQRRLHVLIA
jgi:hypothetical protein